MVIRTLRVLLIIIAFVLLSLPIIIGGAVFLYSPSDERILDYVEYMICQDMDAYDCEIVDCVFSTNIREYSLYTVVQINSDFDVSGFEMDCVYPAQIQNLLHKAYGSDNIPQCCFYIATDEFSCVFDQSRSWLILDRE